MLPQQDNFLLHYWLVDFHGGQPCEIQVFNGSAFTGKLSFSISFHTFLSLFNVLSESHCVSEKEDLVPSMRLLVFLFFMCPFWGSRYSKQILMKCKVLIKAPWAQYCSNPVGDFDMILNGMFFDRIPGNLMIFKVEKESSCIWI